MSRQSIQWKGFDQRTIKMWAINRNEFIEQH
jgi:hypothetical protein